MNGYKTIVRPNASEEWSLDSWQKPCYEEAPPTVSQDSHTERLIHQFLRASPVRAIDRILGAYDRDHPEFYPSRAVSDDAFEHPPPWPIEADKWDEIQYSQDTTGRDPGEWSELRRAAKHFACYCGSIGDLLGVDFTDTNRLPNHAGHTGGAYVSDAIKIESGDVESIKESHLQAKLAFGHLGKRVSKGHNDDWPGAIGKQVRCCGNDNQLVDLIRQVGDSYKRLRDQTLMFADDHDLNWDREFEYRNL